MGNKGKAAVGIGIFTVLMGSIIGYDQFLKDKLNNEDVLVVKEGVNVGENQVLDDSVLEVAGRTKTEIPEGAVKVSDVEKVIGKTSKVSISGNSILTKDVVDYKEVLPDKKKGEAIRPITADMIFATPETIRRGDNIDIYALTEFEWGNLQHSEDEVTKKDLEEVAINKPVLEDVKVAYVRDGSNNEVQNADGTDDEDSEEADKKGNSSSRLYGTSTVSELEVVLKEEDFQNLMSQVTGKGMKLYIVYN